MVIGIETDRGLFAAALVAAGYQVFAVNPMSASRYRDRHAVSGAKSDPGDAKVLADMVRTDRHNHRPAAGDSELAEAVKVLARAHQSMIWSRRRQANMLRSALREFYPAALAAFDDLTSGDAVEVLRAAPGPGAGRGAVPGQIAAALRRGGRQRRIECAGRGDPGRAARPAAAPPPVIAAAMGASVRASVSVIAEMTAQIAVLERQLAADFEQHPDAEVVRSLPGLGTILGARVLGEFGDAPDRYTTAKSRKNYAGTSPITRASGTSASSWPATPATSASPTRSTCGPSPRSPPAPAPAPSTTPPRRRRHPPRGPPRPRQPPRRHPPRLPRPPHPLQRDHRPGPPHRHRPHPGRLTTCSRGMSDPAAAHKGSAPTRKMETDRDRG